MARFIIGSFGQPTTYRLDSANDRGYRCSTFVHMEPAMITGVRSALICDKVELKDGLASYVGLHGAILHPEQTPGLLFVTVALMLEVDETRTRGSVTIEAPDFRQVLPFDFTTAAKLSAMNLPIAIPVLRPAELTVVIRDDRDPHTPWRYGWDLAVNSMAPVGRETPEALIAAAREYGAMVAKGMRSGSASS
jgi:hypothetical protein